MVKKMIVKGLFLLITTFTVGFSQITDGCDLPSSNITIYLHINENGSVLYNSSEPIAAFQFIIDGLGSNASVSISGANYSSVTLMGAEGDAGDAGLMINSQYNAGEGYKLVAFGIGGVAIPAGCGTLVDLDVASGAFTSISSIVISGMAANNLPAVHHEVMLGCMDDGACTVATCGYDSPYPGEVACNYNANANTDDGNQCTYRTFDDPSTTGEFQDEGTNCAGELSIKIANSIPDQFELSQNYPNPFNPSTNISFNVPNLEEISLIVYDLSGKEIITLASGVFTPGIYSITWDAVNNIGESVSSGMYVYRYVTSSKIITRKMLYLK